MNRTRTRTPRRLAPRVGLRVGLVVGPLVASLALAGCSGDDPTAKIAPPKSSTPTVTDTPDATPTESVAALTPEQTVRAWVEAQNVALTTGDTARLKELSADPCQACDDFIKPIERVYQDGGHFQTNGWKVVAAKARSKADNPMVVDVGVSIAGGKTVLHAGAEPVVYVADNRIMVFKVVSQGPGLVVSFIGFVS